MRWSKAFRRQQTAGGSPIEAAEKVVVFGGGSFGTAMGSSLARKKADLDVVLLLRDPYLCADINSAHVNTKYLPVRRARAHGRTDGRPTRSGTHPATLATLPAAAPARPAGLHAAAQRARDH